MGLGYAKGLRKKAAEALVASRTAHGLFRSADDLALRVPLLDKKELILLARIGALNKLDGIEPAVTRSGKWTAPESSKGLCSERAWNHWPMTRSLCHFIK